MFPPPPLPPLHFHCQAPPRATDVVLPLRWRAEASHPQPQPQPRSGVTSDEPAARTKRRRERHTFEGPAQTPTSASVGLIKARKPTYLVQREELSALTDQVRTLEDHLDELRGLCGLPMEDDKAAISTLRMRNFDIEEKLRANDLYLARVQSLQVPVVNPLSTYIHLPQDMAQRHAILRGMQDVKLRRAEQTTFERLHHLDHTIPYTSEEKFTTANGEYHCERMVIEPFANFSSARELFDHFVRFLYHLDASVTAFLGQLTLREVFEDIDPTIWNHHIVTTADDVGCTEELNTVAFARFYDASSGRPGAPYGIIAYDSVNVDDLYPYRPHERTCKDVQTANLVCQVRKPDSDETVVVLKQCLFTVQLPPQFPLAPEKLARLHENCSLWPVVMVKYLREYAATDSPPPPQRTL